MKAQVIATAGEKHPTDFERFVVEYHPDAFIEWEREARQSLELDDWVAGKYWEIVKEYEELLR